MEATDFNLEKIYNDYLEKTIRYNKGQSAEITPDDMFLEHSIRMDLLFVLDELCSEFKEHSNYIFDIFNVWLKCCNANTETKEKYQNFMFNLFSSFTTLVYYKSEIIKWNQEAKSENESLMKAEVYDCHAENIITDKGILKKLKKIKKRANK